MDFVLGNLLKYNITFWKYTMIFKRVLNGYYIYTFAEAIDSENHYILLLLEASRLFSLYYQG